MAKIVHARTKQQIQHVRALLTEYHSSPGYSICFRDFRKEVSTLPGDYAPPKGRLLLATCRRRVAGCVGVCKTDDEGVCKMKRLYVRPEFRGSGVGRALAVAALRAARRLGYARMRLWTFPFMKEAIALYKTLGFRLVATHRSHAGPKVLCMELALETGSALAASGQMLVAGASRDTPGGVSRRNLSGTKGCRARLKE